jgi:Ca-activated chloride channel family protein
VILHPFLLHVLAGLLLLRPGEPQAASFHSGIDLVPIYATVTDRDRRLVSDLSKNDFEIFDDGKPQPIAFFSNDVQPISIVVMLDRSGSMVEHSDLVTTAAEQFVLKLTHFDRARIGNFSYEILLAPSDFTNDRASLLDVLRHRLQPSGPTPVWTAVDRSITALLNESGRRVVLMFTDGHDAPMRGQTRTDVANVIRRAEVDEVMIYAIGVVVPEEPWNPDLAGALGPRLVRPQRSGKLLPPDPNLRKLAEVSGGGYFEINWASNLNGTFARVADELHHQYVMGFTPRTLDGKIHKIDVKVRRPGTMVRARISYLAGLNK